MIILTIKQLIFVGVHLGHRFSNSVFFSAWMLYGMRKKMFVFDLILSLFSFKVSISIIKKCLKMYRPILFINYDIILGTLMSRYGYICGELFSSYKWINGFLTNFKKIMYYNNFLYSLFLSDKYNFRNTDKENISKYYGFVFNRKCLPFSVIVTSLKKAYNVLYETSNLRIPSICIVDSDSYSFNVSIPIPGNDDSHRCVNFYNYFFSKTIMVQKINRLLRFNENKKVIEKKRKKNIFFFLYLNNFIGKNFLKTIKVVNKNNVFKKFFFNYLNKDIIVSWNNNQFFPFKTASIEKKI